MKFRPCIDIHNGKVKQIVGGSLADEGNHAEENFVSDQDGLFYGNLYQKDGLDGGHIILLNARDSEYYNETREEAMKILKAFPGMFQIGGGIDDLNAMDYITAGASHVIVTSFVFKNGEVNKENLVKISNTVGKEHLVIDLSCRKKDDGYYIVTDRWQKFSNVLITPQLMQSFSSYCDEFLVHAVDVEGKAKGIEKSLVSLLAETVSIPITYAGGVGSYEDIDTLRELGKGKLDVTIGSALDLFGGTLEYKKVLEKMD